MEVDVVGGSEEDPSAARQVLLLEDEVEEVEGPRGRSLSVPGGGSEVDPSTALPPRRALWKC